MRRKEPFSLLNRVRSLKYAIFGLKDMILTEHSAWIHVIATASVLYCAWWLEVRGVELALIVIAIALVWSAEVFNTVLEIMADLVVGQRYSSIVKRAKDIAAGAVFIACLAAVVIGFLILGPALSQKLNRFFV